MANLICRERVVVLVLQERRNNIRNNCSPAFFCVFLVKACLRDVVLCKDAVMFGIHQPEFPSISRKAFVGTHHAHSYQDGHFAVCSDHFSPDSFERSLHVDGAVSRLKKGSFPTQCSKLKNIPGCPYFKSRATKAVNLVALMNPWLPGRKTHTFKSSALLKKHPFLSS